MRIYVNVVDLLKKIDHTKLKELEDMNCIFSIHKPYVDEIYKRNRQAVVLKNFRGTFEVEADSKISEDLLERLLDISVYRILKSFSDTEIASLSDEQICKIIEDTSPLDMKLSLYGSSYTRQLGTMDNSEISPYTIPLAMPQPQQVKEKTLDMYVDNKKEKTYKNLNNYTKPKFANEEIEREMQYILAELKNQQEKKNQKERLNKHIHEIEEQQLDR
jgi:hypothetical protein